jgi:hypothetical protein
LPKDAPPIQPTEEMADRLRVNLERLSGEPKADLPPNRGALSAFDPEVQKIAAEYADRAKTTLEGYPLSKGKKDINVGRPFEEDEIIRQLDESLKYSIQDEEVAKRVADYYQQLQQGIRGTRPQRTAQEEFMEEIRRLTGRGFRPISDRRLGQ